MSKGSSLETSLLFEVLLAEHIEAHLLLDRLGALRTIEGADFIHDLTIAKRIQNILEIKKSAALAENASPPGERDPSVTMDSGAADTCAGGINPGWDECEKCGATCDEDCKSSALPQATSGSVDK